MIIVIDNNLISIVLANAVLVQSVLMIKAHDYSVILLVGIGATYWINLYWCVP